MLWVNALVVSDLFSEKDQTFSLLFGAFRLWAIGFGVAGGIGAQCCIAAQSLANPAVFRARQSLA